MVLSMLFNCVVCKRCDSRPKSVRASRSDVTNYATNVFYASQMSCTTAFFDAEKISKSFFEVCLVTSVILVPSLLVLFLTSEPGKSIPLWRN